MASETTKRTFSRRQFLQVAGGATGVLFLAACGPVAAPGVAPAAPAAPAAGVNVVWWRSLGGTNGEAIEEMVANFNGMQEQVTIQSEFQGGYSDLRDKFAAAAAAGAMPDMVMFADMTFPPFARNNLLEPLDDLLAASEDLSRSDYFGVLDRGAIDGVLYQVPLGVSTPIFYYNEDMINAAGLEGPPQTWDDLLDVYIPATTVKEGDQTKIFGYSFLANVDWWWQQSYVWMYGGDLSDGEWNVYFDSEQVIDFLTRFQNAFKAGQAHIPTEAEGGAKGYFGSGFAANMVESTGVIGAIDDLVEGRFVPAVSYLPEGPAGRKVPTGGNGLSIVSGRSAEVRDAAWTFIKWMQQPEQIAFFDGVSGYLAFTSSAAEYMADFLAANPRRKVAVDQMAWSRPQSNIQTIPRAVDIYYDAMLQVLQGGADPATLMPEVQKQVEAVLVEEGFRTA